MQQRLQTTKERSRLMGQVKGRRNRTTELRLVEILRRNAIHGWRRHAPLPGTPDFVFRDARLAVFVDGCFWHCCPWCYTAPKRNAAFWFAKAAANRRRDKRNNKDLRSRGWRVLRIWEHELDDQKKVVRRIRRALISI
ncbi:MAG: very short patch repair endonuclease [Betaproteobacteria bacterium]|nr:MAG: very short patch repair endonuclease [Betaproteobacteria bacterium]